MENRADVLRHKIAVYRRYLADGVDSDLAPRYLREIKRLEAELVQIAKDSEKR